MNPFEISLKFMYSLMTRLTDRTRNISFPLTDYVGDAHMRRNRKKESSFAARRKSENRLTPGFNESGVAWTVFMCDTLFLDKAGS